MFLDKYVAAKDRTERSKIIDTVIGIMREACPVGAFITKEDGRWCKCPASVKNLKWHAFNLYLVQMQNQLIDIFAPLTILKGNVDEKTAREKVGTFFRDSLGEHYKSSAKAKINRRKQTTKRRQKDGEEPNSQSSKSGSTISGNQSSEDEP